jgi:hypothetical protein
MALITAGDCRDFVPQAAGHEATLATRIAQAEARADNYCKRRLNSATYTEIRDIGDCQSVVLLRNYPVVGAVVIQEDYNTTTPTTLVLATDYVIDSDIGQIDKLGAYFPGGQRNLAITYTAGYTSTTCPAGLKAALYELVGWLIEMAGNRNATQESADGYSVTYEKLIDGIPESLASDFDPYRRRVLG